MHWPVLRKDRATHLEKVRTVFVLMVMGKAAIITTIIKVKLQVVLHNFPSVIVSPVPSALRRTMTLKSPSAHNSILFQGEPGVVAREWGKELDR